MDHLELLERLNTQVEKLITELSNTREENARLAEELLDCRSESDSRAETVSNQQEELSLQTTEIEGLLSKIGGALQQ